ncbi:MAG: hypothetical protein KIT16_14740 [Rhodospirillaceae bacterium]|nr:hypothetical protein [Rhodospirillaceae bacterium]
MQGQGDGNFRGGSVACGSSRLQWRAAGQGDLVIDLVSDAAPSRFHDVLAERFHVATLEARAAGTSAAASLANALGEVVAATAHDRCSLILRGAMLPQALHVLRERPSLVETLILLAPPPAPETALLDALAAAALPLLVLSGTRGRASPAEAGSPFRARVRTCHYVLVYDAGDAVEIDRPEATASVVGEFITHRDRFIVAHASGQVHP